MLSKPFTNAFARKAEHESGTLRKHQSSKPIGRRPWPETTISPQATKKLARKIEFREQIQADLPVRS
jgi:hypothetical protein